MHRPLAIFLTSGCLLIAAAVGHSQPSANAPQPAGEQELVAQGRYIVHDVAKCILCHTPRNRNGSLQMERLLMGAPVPIESPFPDQQWAFKAPPLAGMPGGWTEDQLVALLHTGTPPDGEPLRPPMPQFHLKPADARAVAAYLKSLR